jgi:hypothetical protein
MRQAIIGDRNVTPSGSNDVVLVDHLATVGDQTHKRVKGARRNWNGRRAFCQFAATKID